MPVTHWIYPTNEKSNYYLDTANGNTEVSPQQLFNDIRQNPSEVDRWVLGTGFRQMRPGDAVWVYASTPYQYICALAQAVDVDFDGDFWHASLVWNLDATQRLMHEPIPRSMFGQIAQRAAVRANQHTTEVLDAWLTNQRLTLPDLDSEPSPGEDTRLRTLRAIVQRQGQHAFRQRLLGAYDGRCAVTGERTLEVLEAAHIDGYMGPHSNLVTNGLLLRADLHTLFDLYRVGVDQEGRLVVFEGLAGSSYAKLHGKRLSLPPRAQDQPSKRRLATHLRRCHSSLGDLAEPQRNSM
ncbi:HNH endonuclease [Micromonospora sp. DT68]|uniref:HNH endonuclease n=1 Tax=Micromonospora sp. DT68 TaxID=3416522 RepID=UPI003CF527D8